MFHLKNIFSVVVVLTLQSTVFAWGGRGHDTICQSAVHLVENEELKAFLMNRPNVMGYLCNVPDVYWKSLPADVTKHGNHGHYFNSDYLARNLKDVPTDFNKILSEQTNALSKTLMEMGTLWWRANQFYNLSIDSAKKIKGNKPPTNSKEEQDASLDYNKNVYDMMVYMGLLGHFVGDEGQPYHVTMDHDGYGAGHGGIHSYYEDASVAFMTPSLMDQIVKKAKSLKNKSFTNGTNPLEQMKALAIITYDEIKSVLKVDPMTVGSSLKIENGVATKKPAERRDPSVGAKNFQTLASTEMARSALLLAKMWDNIYKEAGEPELKKYKSFKYPYTPDFVEPNYYKTGDL